MSLFRLGRALLSAGAAVVGAILIVRPFTSLAWFAVVLGIALAVIGSTEIVRARDYATAVSAPAGCLIIGTGMVVAAWPGLSIRTVSVLVAAGLVVFGLARVVDAVRGTGAARVADGLIGVSGTALAVVAGLPGLTLFVVTPLLGAGLVWSGVAGLFYLFGRRSAVVRPQAPRIVGAVVAAAVTVPLALVAADVPPRTSEPDGFYHAAADGEPGTLLRVKTFNGDVPAHSRAWQILYTTQNEAGRPAVASGVVIAPEREAPEPSPVIAWAHPTTGIAQGCAPSLSGNSFAADRAPALAHAVSLGWTVVASDYIGLGTEGPHPYLIGRSEAHSVLDAVRAARSIDALRLSPETVLWGASQGGHAALWADTVQPTYAPDIPLAGVAAVAPIADLRPLAQTLTSSGDPTIGAYLLTAYAELYGEVHPDDYLRVQAQLPMRELARRCLPVGDLRGPIVSLAVGTSPYTAPLDRGALGRRLSENTPGGATATPLLVLQGDDDRVVVPAVQSGYVERRRGTGATVEYRTYPGRGHDDVLADRSPAVDELIAWTRDRLS